MKSGPRCYQHPARGKSFCGASAMETLSQSPDVAKCVGCGVVCGVVGDFGLADPLCETCSQAQWRWEAERSISDSVSIILGRKPFDCLSIEDRQELLNRFFAGIGYVPDAVNPDEADQWLNPPEFNVNVRDSAGHELTIPWQSLESAKA